MSGRSGTVDEALRDVIGTARDVGRAEAGTVGRLIGVSIDANTVQVLDLLDDSIPVDEMASRIASALREEQHRVSVRDRAGRGDDSIGATTIAGLLETSSGSVSGAFDRIRAWVDAEVPGKGCLVGASRDEIVRGEQVMGVRWPVELRAHFGCINGSPLQLLPAHDLLSIGASVRVRAMWLEIASDLLSRRPEMSENLDPHPRSAEDAGTPAGVYLPEFIPIADRDGATLVVDTRGGDMHGCVTEYSSAGADDAGPRWVSIGAMLDDLASSFETRRPFLGCLPSTDGNRIVWTARPEM